jgi:RNA polymerase sigma-70 factor (ECF subfamily)
VTHDSDSATLFSELYRSYYPLILATCTRRLSSIHRAEEATQEVFRIAWQHEPKEDLSIGWLYATARNVVGNEYRRVARAAAAQSQLDAPLSTLTDSTDGLDVRSAMNALRPADRELLYMAYWEDLSADEIGQILGKSSGAVWVRLTRAREALRRHLKSSAGWSDHG